MSRRPRRGGRYLGAPLLVTALILASCSQPPQLAHTQRSPEDLARAALAALNDGDRQALDALAVTESEFKGLVWPRLPASRPERRLPWTYVWASLHDKSVLYLRSQIADRRYAGFEVVRVHFAGESTDYGGYRVHRETVVTLRDRSGAESTHRLFGSVIEQNGRYKVFSYVVD
jgi:hypothetical protein